MKHIALYLIISVVFTGCMSQGTSIDSNGKDLRLAVVLITSHEARGCSFVGIATGHVYNPLKSSSENIDDAMVKAANNIAALGANAAILKGTDIEEAGHDVTVGMSGYSCS